MIAEEEATARPTVWVVDDSPLDARQAQKALADWCSVQVFSDGSVALEQFSTQSPPDVIVLDWVMPGVTGIEVVKFLRSEKGPMAQVPVLLLTAQQHPQQIAEGLAAGANDYLPKPYAPEELCARAQALVRWSQLLARTTAAEKAFRELLANTPDAILAIDAYGRITYANPEASHVFGLSIQTLIGHPVQDLLPTLSLGSVRPVAGQSFPPLPDVAIQDRIYAPSVRIPAADAGASSIMALRDVTERRDADRRRLDFYSIIAHDLRSPLSAMLLRADLLLTGKRGPLSVEATDDLRRFSGNIRSMVEMINGFLDLARLEDPNTRVDAISLDLAAIVETTVDDLQPLAEAGKLSLDWSPPPTEMRVLGDKVRLGQVLSNLIGNALKYTPAGGKVTIAAQVAENAIEIRISDTGPGIPNEALSRLFDRFTRVAATARTMGTGLGLMIVREIVEAHGGQVGVTSEPGKGSTFWFRLPRIDVRPPRASASG
jgi:two-component system phosphate regulon sensor histidine kinase PhoR